MRTRILRLSTLLALVSVIYGCSQKPLTSRTPTPKVTPTVAANAAPADAVKAESYTLKEVPASLTIYVPKGSKLERRVIKGKLYDPSQMPTALSTYAFVVAEQSLPLLLQAAPGYFPNGTKITDIDIKETTLYISLSQQFLQPSFWKSKAQLDAAVYAVVNTAVEGYSQPANNLLNVSLLVDEKPVREVSGIGINNPLLPRYDLVVNRKSE